MSFLACFRARFARPACISVALLSAFSLFANAQGTPSADSPNQAATADEIKELRSAILVLQQRLDRIEARSGRPATPNEAVAADNAPSNAPATAPSSEGLSSSQPAITPVTKPDLPVLNTEDRKTLDFLNGTTINVGFDGYYAYNFNQPIGRVNLLRAYDVSSNSFSINQLSLVIEHAPNPAAGQRFGIRTDFQYGQATETLQGGAQNELRPQVYRNLFQAYGTYVAPLGKGLTVDFGKWASALGAENNYTKDQINYSRSYLFNFLPFYHMGFRANYDVTPKLNVAYWLVNGAQQTEDFNGFKSQAFLFTIKPKPTISWNVNYYFGEEQRDTNSVLNPGLPVSGAQPGQPSANISPAPNGREHIFDSYVTWNATPKLTLVGEADYVINRYRSHSSPSHVSAGAAYARYQISSAYAAAARFEYFSDRGGLFSGITQTLKEGTFTFDRKVANGFLIRTEFRRDFSNQPYFLTDVPNVLKPAQTTATLGLVLWVGQKQGAW